jgi:hypothetical protein
MIWYIQTMKPYPATMITASRGASTKVRTKKTVSSRDFVGISLASDMMNVAILAAVNAII